MLLKNETLIQMPQPLPSMENYVSVWKLIQDPIAQVECPKPRPVWRQTQVRMTKDMDGKSSGTHSSRFSLTMYK